MTPRDLDPQRAPRMIGFIVLVGILLVGVEQLTTTPAQGAAAYLVASGVLTGVAVWMGRQNRKDDT